MKSFQIGECRVDLLPVVNGLVSETEKVREVYGRYEAYAVTLGIEGLEAVRRRAEIGDDGYEVSELDIVYSKRMGIFGDVEIPSPALCELVDACARDGVPIIPLDMCDEDYDTAYIECVNAFQFTNQHRLAKKGLKTKLDATSPEAMARSWDAYIASKNKGLHKLDLKREAHIASEILDTAKYRRSLLVLIECERADGVAEALADAAGMR